MVIHFERITVATMTWLTITEYVDHCFVCLFFNIVCHCIV